MEQTKNKWMKVLVPVVAVVVILEAVVLIGGMAARRTTGLTDQKSEPIAGKVEARMRLKSDKKEMSVGESGEAEVVWDDAAGHQIDGIQLYVAYDPEFFELTDLAAGEKLGQPELMTVSSKKSVIMVMYLVEEKDGLKIEEGERVSVLKFKFLAKKAGSSGFEIRTSGGGGGLVTRVAETMTSRAIAFSADKLVISIK